MRHLDAALGTLSASYLTYVVEGTLIACSSARGHSLEKGLLHGVGSSRESELPSWVVVCHVLAPSHDDGIVNIRLLKNIFHKYQKVKRSNHLIVKFIYHEFLTVSIVSSCDALL